MTLLSIELKANHKYIELLNKIKTKNEDFGLNQTIHYYQYSIFIIHCYLVLIKLFIITNIHYSLFTVISLFSKHLLDLAELPFEPDRSQKKSQLKMKIPVPIILH